MSRLFNVENPVMTYFALLRDWVILSALWAVCSLPIITIGPATAAIYYVTLKMVRQEQVSVTGAFFRAFKDNFKQGVVLTLFLLVCFTVLGFSAVYAVRVPGSMRTVAVFFVVSLCASFLCITLYSFPFMAQFSNSVPGILKSAAFLAGKNLTNTIVMLLLNLIPVWVFLLSFEVFLRALPLWVFMAPGAISYICAGRLTKIFAPIIASIQARNAGDEQ